MPDIKTHTVTATAFKGNRSRPLVTLEPKAGPATSLVIVSHGLGDTAMGWYDAAAMVLAPGLPHARIILPTAPTRPITLNGGMKMPGWYDISSLAADRSKERADGIQDTRKELTDLLAEHATPEGGDGKLRLDRCVLMGFSQGAALSLFTALQSEHRLAGCMVLSGYLPSLEEAKAGATDAGRRTPVRFCHGDEDGVVIPAWGEDAAANTRAMREGFEGAGAVDWKLYADLEHSANMEELADVLAALKAWLPDER